MKKLLLITMMCVMGLFGNLKAQEAETISIGSGDATINYSPTYTDNYYSVSQQIFTADEMQNKSGKITSVAFKCTRKNPVRTLKVYMVNTDKTSFDVTTDWVAVTDADLVYEGSVSFTENVWTTITFQTPFTYKKGKNVLLCINDVTTTGTGVVSKFASERRTENRMLYKGAYSEILATNLSAVEGKVSSDVNQVQFTLVDDGSGEELNPAPNAPANLKAEALSDTQIKLTWDAVENATSYNVYQKGIEEAIAKGLNATEYIVENLNPSTTYYFTVTASADLESEKSAEVSANTMDMLSTFEFNFEDETIGGMRVFQGEGATGENWGTLKDHIKGGDIYNMLKSTYSGVDGSFAVISLSVKLLDENTVYIPNNYIVTEKPYLITETSTLEWDIRQVGLQKEDQYAIVISEDGKTFNEVWYERYGNKTGETKAYSLAKYTGKALYIGFRHYEQTNGAALTLDNIKLVLDSELTPEEEIDFTAPAIPSGVTVKGRTENSITIGWNVAANAESYNVYQAGIAEAIKTGITATEYKVEGLKPNTLYSFTVTAVKGEKESGKSSAVEAKTLEEELDFLPAPKNVKAVSIDDETIVITWDAVEGATSYQIHNDEFENPITEAETSHKFINLDKGAEYCYTVTALNSTWDLVSSHSEPACATVGELPVELPAAPVVTVKETTETTVVLTWLAVDGAEGYKVYEGENFLADLAATTTSYTAEDLKAGTEYKFVVSAFNKEGETKSQEVSAKTQGTAEPEEPETPEEPEEGIDEVTTSVSIYPNPVNNVINIETESNIETVMIYNITGVMVGQQTTDNAQKTMSVDVTSLNSGVYFVKVVTNNGEVVKHIVKN